MNWTLVVSLSLLVGAGEGKPPKDLPTEVITVYGHERETIDREKRRMQEKLEDELRTQYGLAEKRSVPGRALDVGEVSSEAGVLTVFSTPTDAPVYLDGSLIGSTPLTTDKVSVGPHLLALKKKGYEEHQKLFLMRPLSEVALEVTLDKHYSYRFIEPVGDGQLHYPTRVLSGQGETVFVADGGNGRLLALPEPQSPGTGWIYPKGMASGRAGRLVYVADFRRNAVLAVNISTGEAEVFAEAGLSGPSDVEVDYEGNIWVVDSNNCRLLKFSPDGRQLQAVGARGDGAGAFLHPEALAVDTEGNLYVADWGNSRVQKLDRTGGFVGVMGGFGIGLEKMRFPEDVDIDQDGYVLVADSGNDRLLKFRPDGSFVAEVLPLDMEEGVQGPCGLWAGAGELLVVERHRHRVLRLAAEWDQEYVPH
jgi:DNA-binding beta-propeller fold protein YncE